MCVLISKDVKPLFLAASTLKFEISVKSKDVTELSFRLKLSKAVKSSIPVRFEILALFTFKSVILLILLVGT